MINPPAADKLQMNNCGSPAADRFKLMIALLVEWQGKNHQWLRTIAVTPD